MTTHPYLKPISRSIPRPHQIRFKTLSILIYTLFISFHPSQSLRNDSYGFDDQRFVYMPRVKWHFDHQNGIAFTNLTGANVTTQFFGSAIYLSSSQRADRFHLQVTIDGQDHYDINLNGPDTTDSPPQVLWGISLVEGNHTFVATNTGVDPTRPYVAFASLTITTGQPVNTAPPVSSTPFYSLGQKQDDHTERNAVIRKVGAAIGAVLSFLVLVFIGYRMQKRRHLQQLQQYLHTHRVHPATSRIKVDPSTSEAMVLAPRKSQVGDVNYQHSYFSIHHPQSYPASSSSTRREEPHRSLLVVSEAPPSSTVDQLSSDEFDDSEFWRPRPTSNSSLSNNRTPS